MIRPTKYMDPNTSILNVSAEVLAELMKTSIRTLQELDELVQTRIEEKARINFIPAINLLYLIGCIDYDVETDAVYYLKEKEKNQ